MKRILLALSILFAIPTQATHLLGGEMYWECNGGGQYIFTLVLYRDCNGIVLSTGPQTISTDHSAGSISCPFVRSEDISIPCYDPTFPATCASANASSVYQAGAIMRYVYQSAPVNLTGTPPANGWTFSWTSCCRPATNINSTSGPFYLYSKMYQADPSGCLYNAPRFIEDPIRLLGPNGSFSAQASTFDPMDVVDHAFENPMTAAASPAVWSAGYSTSAPFPDTSEDTANGLVSINNLTGEVNYDVVSTGSSSSTGTFIYAVKASSFRNGVLIAECTRDMTAFLAPSSAPNSVPIFTMDTSAASTHVLNQLSPTHYSVNCFMGDTLNLEMFGQDFDFLPNFTPQSIAFGASGYFLDSTWMGPYPLPSNIVSLTPKAPQTGFVQALQNTIQFEWITPTLPINQFSNTFTFTMTDDFCPPKQAKITLQVNMINALSIAKTQVSYCSGDSVQLSGFTASGNYQWMPNTDISDNTASSPFVNPGTSRYYYLVDPTNSALIDSVYVSVDARPQISLNYQNDLLDFSSNSSLDDQQWQYNGIGFEHAADSLTPFGSGEFWMTVNSKSCTVNSDSVSVLKSKGKTLFDPNFGTANDSVFKIDQNSIAIDFQISEWNLTELSSITMLGLRNDSLIPSSNSSISFKIYDAQSQTEIWNYSTNINAQGQVLNFPANLNLKTNKKYTLQVFGDSSLLVQAFEVSGFPFTPYANGLQVLGASNGPASQFPSVSGNLVPAMILNFKQFIGLEEHDFSHLNMYPNPVNNQLTISNLIESQSYELSISNAAGNQLVQENVQNQTVFQVNTTALPAGLYIVNLKTDRGSWNQKFIKK